jgi:hypothetical protein
MDEMSANEQLGLPIRQFANRVRLPDFLKECFSHRTLTEQPFAPEGKFTKGNSPAVIFTTGSMDLRNSPQSFPGQRKLVFALHDTCGRQKSVSVSVSEYAK